jgi:uncharacterized protein YegL
MYTLPEFHNMKKLLAAFALLFLASPSFAADNVVVLLDTSGSMDERLGSVSKMKAAQDALCGVVDRVGPNTHIGIITFNGWIANLGPVNKESLKQAIRATRASGGTPLGKYVKDAADALIEARKRDKGLGTFKLVIATDGEATDGNLLAENIVHVKARGIVIETIGVGMKDDHALAKSSKVYMRANDPESLKQAVNASVAEVGGGNSAVSDEDFRMIAPLDPKLSGHIITALTSPPDTPIGEPVTVYTVKEDGTLDKSGTVNPTEVAKANTGGGGLPTWGWVCIGVVVFLVIVVVVAAGSSRR